VPASPTEKATSRPSPAGTGSPGQPIQAPSPFSPLTSANPGAATITVCGAPSGSLPVRPALGPAHRQIEVGLGKIDIAIAAHQRKAQRGIFRAERGQSLAEPGGKEIARAGNGIDVAGLARLHRLYAFFKAQEAFADGVQPGRCLVGQFQALGRAAEQHDAEQVFERADLLAHGRRGHCQFVGGASEGQVAGGGIEHAQPVEREMGPLHRWFRPLFWRQVAVAGAASGKNGMATSNTLPSSRRMV
jgi:hypothetical protein